jgi:hypothetical protein
MPAADTNASRSTFTAVSTAAHLIRSGWTMARPKITYIRCAISNRRFLSTFKPLLTKHKVRDTFGVANRVGNGNRASLRLRE